MKNKLFRILLICLTGAILFTGCSTGADTEDPTGTNAVSEEITEILDQGLVAVKNGKSDYKIVYPEGNEVAKSAATTFKTTVFRKTGATLSVISDSTAATANEILIGATNREASGVVSLNGYLDYYAGAVDTAIVLNAGSKKVFSDLFEDFFEFCLQNDTIVVPGGWELKNINEYIHLTEKGESDYVIVVKKNSSYDNGRAAYVRDLILERTGVTLPIVFDTAAATDKEILIGTTSREESQGLVGTFTTDADYFVGIKNEKLILQGETEYSLGRAVEWFEENCLYQSDSLSILSATEQNYICDYKDYRDLAALVNCEYEGSRKTLSTLEKVTLFTPKTQDDWNYNHQVHIERINGTFVAAWSQSRHTESDCGQRIAYSTSTDGIHWSDTKILMDTKQGKYSEVVLTCQGIYNNGEELVVYIRETEYEKKDLRTDENGNYIRPILDSSARSDSIKCWYVTTTDGNTWTAPVNTGDRKGGGCNGPILLENGTLFFPAGGLYNGYTTDTSGKGLASQWGATALPRTQALAEGAKMLCEASFYIRDGIMYLFARSGGNLWICFSEDYGKTFSEGYETNFTDSSSKFMFGQFADGRYWYVGNPEPKSGRLPLVLMISDDGINFDEQYILGNTPYNLKYDSEYSYKGGAYSYPNCYVGNDGYFYVAYARGKEEIEICRFALSEIGISENAS